MLGEEVERQRCAEVRGKGEEKKTEENAERGKYGRLGPYERGKSRLLW